MCMHFNYRLVGKNSELAISVEPRNMDVEMLWFVKGPQGNKFWKNGQVSLGLVSEFRVSEVNEFRVSVESKRH